MEVIKKEVYKEALDEMSKALYNLDEHVIGLAKIHNLTEVIVKKDKDTFITFRIGALLGSSTSFYPVNEFKHCIFMFPNKMTLAELKKDPFALNDFMQKNKL